MLGFAVTEVALFLLVLKQPVTLLLHGIWLQMLLISLEDNCLTFLGYYRAMVPKIYPAQGKFFFFNFFFQYLCVCVHLECFWSATRPIRGGRLSPPAQCPRHVCNQCVLCERWLRGWDVTGR